MINVFLIIYIPWHLPENVLKCYIIYYMCIYIYIYIFYVYIYLYIYIYIYQNNGSNRVKIKDTILCCGYHKVMIHPVFHLPDFYVVNRTKQPKFLYVNNIYGITWKFACSLKFIDSYLIDIWKFPDCFPYCLRLVATISCVEKLHV